MPQKLFHPCYPFQLPNCFEILYGTWQYHCHAPCKISKQFKNCSLGCGQTRFCEIWFYDEFQRDIPHCDSPHGFDDCCHIYPSSHLSNYDYCLSWRHRSQPLQIFHLGNEPEVKHSAHFMYFCPYQWVQQFRFLCFFWQVSVNHSWSSLNETAEIYQTLLTSF